ncbi:helix-turn-helix domain-containing protein [Aurantiacibacter spongiae]|uniref:AraC family transcriptional regulator n=1 Tax=Aurantiacibacter spongiae TaxID=2488860 RepID=A0A3N5CXA9_9SPHN|nr:helix-turn-helix domain-containing protein [Aurantiacibacter spongiae]RPF71289.1 AraC family transcriptional regulator [Aurantiacibacter spongiae]
MGQVAQIGVRYYRLSEAVAPFFTALYFFTVSHTDGDPVEDYLLPEWAAMRFTAAGEPPHAAVVPDPIRERWPFVCSGPTSRAIRFQLKDTRTWGLGMRPVGWARFLDAQASDVNDEIVNGNVHDAFAFFRPLLRIARNHPDDPDEGAAAIDRFLVDNLPEPNPAEDQIEACIAALSDPEVADVTMLCERVGVSRRTVERLCSRYFGYSPKLLLRRQRFLRSVGRFTFELSSNWSKAIDPQYCDQAHFVRDFRKFMDMSPSEYVEMDHPILARIIAQRLADQGAVPEPGGVPVIPAPGPADTGWTPMDRGARAAGAIKGVGQRRSRR